MDKKSEGKTGKKFWVLGHKTDSENLRPTAQQGDAGWSHVNRWFPLPRLEKYKKWNLKKKITKASWVTVSQEMVFTAKVWVGSWNGFHILGIRNMWLVANAFSF